MLKITLLCVGKIKGKWLQAGTAEYKKRLSRFANLDIIEVADQPDNIPLDRALALEGEALAKRIPARGMKIALELSGQMLDSVEMSQKLQQWMDRSDGQITFIIGGSRGIDEQILKICDYHWCLSPLTFPHTLTRIIVLEQLYRGFRLGKGEIYHK